MRDEEFLGFEEIDHQLARWLGARLSAEDRVLLALVSRSVRDGQSYCDAGSLAAWSAEDPARRDWLLAQGASEFWSSLPDGLGRRTDTWIRHGIAARARGAELVDDQGQPIVVDEAGRIYLRRYFEAECELARRLVSLARQGPETRPVAPELRGRVAAYFPEAGAEGERLAVEQCLNAGLSIISGGPGTGKTTLVAKLVALLLEKGTLERRPLEILLLAPTGKAADRMLEATGQAIVKLPVPPAIIAQVPTSASTIHRALEAGFGAKGRFRRSADNPLLADCILVDEASMVDLSLMLNLVRAIKPGARLILLGDEHQLASVEAGAVLSEILRVTSGSGWLEQPPPSQEGGLAESGVCAVRRTKSYRFSAGGGVAALSTAIREGNPRRARELLGASANLGICFVAARSGQPSEELLRRFAEKYRDLAEAPDPAQALAAFAKFRVLAALRHGPSGVEAWNQALRDQLGRRYGAHYRGEPLLITRNDARLGLFNGDVGVVWPTAEGQLAAYFRTGSAGTRSVPLASLPEHEVAYAMTVHKSQGSEYDEVAIVLPESERSPSLTRELLYTAVTRARTALTIVGSEEVLIAALERPTRRASALGERLLQLARTNSSTP